jgi:hypothetical protein
MPDYPSWSGWATEQTALTSESGLFMLYAGQLQVLHEENRLITTIISNKTNHRRNFFFIIVLFFLNGKKIVLLINGVL